MIDKLKEMYKVSGYNKQFIILIVIIIVTTIIEMISIPYITKRIIDISIPSGNIKLLIIWGCVYIIFLLISCYFILKHCNIRKILERLIQKDLREKIFNKIGQVKTKFFDENDTGVILQFLQTDVNDAGKLFANVIVEMYLMGLIRFSIVVIFLIFIDVKITLITLAIYLIGYGVTLFFNRKTISLINKIRKINMEIYSKVNEGVQGFLTIKILNIINKKENELKELLQEYSILNNKLEKTVSEYNNIFSFIVSLCLVVIIYYGGIKVVQGCMAYVEIMLLIQYSGSLKLKFNWFIKHLTNFNKSFVAFSKILEFLNLENIEILEEGKELQEINMIEFSKVYFSYTGYEKNIEDFSVILNRGEKLALIGRTGSGKTTIANLLCRFYEPVEGKIIINGDDYLSYSISSLRNKIGYVMQDVSIFPNTIIDNIKYVNKDITEEEIYDIFKKLKLHDKIMKLEDGYNTDIFCNPDILSTGEKQMINFARVMAIDYDVVILDEVTSALSYENEILVSNAIKEIIKDKIAVIIAHRLTTIKDCDKILLIKDGKIIEQGNNTELMKKQGEYYDLINT